jgi:hypothetical protein
LTDFNYLGNQTAVIPAPIGDLPAVSGSASEFSWNVPAYSINVVQFDLSPAGSAGATASASITAGPSASSTAVSQMSDGEPQAATMTKSA